MISSWLYGYCVVAVALCWQMSTHPDLNQYIKDVLDGLEPWLQKRQVDRVCVAICDKSSNLRQPLEQFVFELGYLQASLDR